MDMTHFLQMGGYAAYVWPSYGLALIILAANLIVARRRHTRTQRQLATLAKQRKRPA